MARYIKSCDCAKVISEKFNIPLGDVIDVVYDIPAADVEEVKHGYWEEIKTGEKLYDYCFKCSNCNNETPPNSFVVSPDYCPNCGAKMDGRGDT